MGIFLIVYLFWSNFLVIIFGFKECGYILIKLFVIMIKLILFLNSICMKLNLNFNFLRNIIKDKI